MIESREYRHASGLSELAEALQPGDVVYAGEIPMAALTENDRVRLLAYPAFLARRLNRRDSSAELRVRYVVPDWASDETRALPGHPLNMTPSGRTYARQPDPEPCDESRSLHWEALFDSNVREIMSIARGIDVSLVRASELRGDTGFQSVLRLALRRPQQVREAFQESNPVTEILDEPLQFAGSSCRACGSIRGETTYIDDWDRVEFACGECDNRQEADIQEQDFWVDDTVLAAAVTAALRPAASVVREGPRWEARERVIDSLVTLAAPDQRDLPARLIAPTVDSERGGTPLHDLVTLAEEWNESVVELP